jgi:hypothetical protein
MSAQHLPLEPWLETLVNNQVLSMQEASLFQDHSLLAEPGEVVSLPQELMEPAKRAWLFNLKVGAPLQ